MWTPTFSSSSTYTKKTVSEYSFGSWSKTTNWPNSACLENKVLFQVCISLRVLRDLRC